MSNKTHQSINTSDPNGHHNHQAIASVGTGAGNQDNNLFLDDLVQDFDISLSGFGTDSTANVTLIRDLNQVISTLGDNIKVEAIDPLDHEDNAQDSSDAKIKYFRTHSIGGNPESPLSNDNSCGSSSTYTSSTDSDGRKYGTTAGPGSSNGNKVYANYQPSHPNHHHHQHHAHHHQQYPQQMSPLEPIPQIQSPSSPIATIIEGSVGSPGHTPRRVANKRLCFKGLSTEELSPISSVSSSMDTPSIQNFPSDISDTSNEPVGYSSRNIDNSYGYSWRRYSKTDAPSVHNKMSSVQVGKTIKSEPNPVSRLFQYILGAPTASGVKQGAMSMTYLNQAQPYEIRLKKLSDIPNYDGKNLRTTMRLGIRFVEKRLQYRENEEMVNWCRTHAKDRILDVDFALSYGVFDVQIPSADIASVEFVWNPNREASIFVKLNCISTEFTSKRHGGERGAPLRLIIDTYSTQGNAKLDSAQCLVKVFKSKGADRKHKTDRERLSKQPDSTLYYQPSYDCTLFTLYSDDDVYIPTSSSPTDSDCPSSQSTITSTRPVTASPGPPLPTSGADNMGSVQHNIATSSTTCYQSSQQSDDSLPIGSSTSATVGRALPPEATPAETYEWLNRNRFNRLTDVLMNFSSDDLRRLSREDLIQICGLSDGIRLFNTIHAIQGSTRLTIFVTTDGKGEPSTVHNGIYLKTLTHEEFRQRLIETLGIPPGAVRHLYLIGPNDIRIKLTNDVVMNMKNESIYSCSIDKDTDQDEYDLVLQSTGVC